jgi:hypothetical protein
MHDASPKHGANEIRAVLAAATCPLTVREIFDLCDSINDTTQVASMLHEEVRTGRAVRSGEPRHYSYSLTDTGRAVAAKPEILRSRTNRRTKGRRLPPAPTPAAAKPIQPDAEPLPAAVPTAEAPAAIPPPHYDPADVALSSLPTALAPVAAALAEPRATFTADLAARLACAVVMHWRGPLDGMPSDLRNLVDAGLSLRAAA